jgi:hypothetical protein
LLAVEQRSLTDHTTPEMKKAAEVSLGGFAASGVQLAV